MSDKNNKTNEKYLEEVREFYILKKRYEKYKYILICNCCNQFKNNTDINIGSWHALNSQYLPLKKYSPVRLGFYNTKEVSLIIT